MDSEETSHTSFDPYCRLYLHTTLVRSELFAKCGNLLHCDVSGFSIVAPLFSFNLRDNDDFDEIRFSREKSFVFSRYTAWIEGEEKVVDKDAFISSVCELIVGLREGGILVAASCEFEDCIAEQTGWNWTSSSRDHPPVVS